MIKFLFKLQKELDSAQKQIYRYQQEISILNSKLKYNEILSKYYQQAKLNKLINLKSKSPETRQFIEIKRYRARRSKNYEEHYGKTIQNIGKIS